MRPAQHNKAIWEGGLSTVLALCILTECCEHHSCLTLANRVHSHPPLLPPCRLYRTKGKSSGRLVAYSATDMSTVLRRWGEPWSRPCSASIAWLLIWGSG